MGGNNYSIENITLNFNFFQFPFKQYYDVIDFFFQTKHILKAFIHRRNVSCKLSWSPKSQRKLQFKAKTNSQINEKSIR